VEKSIEKIIFKEDFSSLSPPEISSQALADFAYAAINRAYQKSGEQRKECEDRFQYLISHTLRFSFQLLTRHDHFSAIYPIES